MNTAGKAGDPLVITLLAAAAFHAFVILGIGFKPSDRNRPEHRQQNLEIMVVRNPRKVPEEVEKADFLAQVAQQGGGEAEKPNKPVLEDTPATLPRPEPVPMQPTPRDPTPRQLTAEVSPHKTEIPPPREEPPPQLSASQLLASKNLEIARLTAELERKTRAYAKMPKRKTLNATTKEAKYVAYLDAWRRKVERIGTLNFPDQAKRKGFYGSPVLLVSVRADGSVEQISVRYSSGSQVIDDAAVRIVRMAAPFSPFPEEIRKETDILDIVRTWQFLGSGRLESK